MHSNKLEVSMVLVDVKENIIIRLPKDWRKRICNPSYRIFLMVCGYLTKRRDTRKRKFRRIVLDPLTHSCHRIQFKRKPSLYSGALYIGIMKVGKKINVRQQIIDKALEQVAGELGEICN